MHKKIRVAIADDHKPVRNAIANLLMARGFDMAYECENGKELIDKIPSDPVDIVIVDLNMPVMNGWEATTTLQKSHPPVQIIALSMLDDDLAVEKMIRAGARAYLLKDAEPDEWVRAIQEVSTTGFYHSDFVSGSLRKKLSPLEEIQVKEVSEFSEREIRFLQLVCTELTYKEIAAKMNVSPRTVDGYWDSLFFKLDAKSRVGLVIFTIRHRLIEG